jgi:ADP-heptose:LPS heptosyltransferase
VTGNPRKKRLLFIRHAALGDTLLTSPFFRQLHEDQPSAAIDLFSLSGEAVEGAPGFGEWISMHDVSPKGVLRRRYAAVYWFSYEHDPSLHILDGYEISTGLKLRNRTLQWTVDPIQAERASHRMEGLKRPFIGFSPTSAHEFRSLSVSKAQEVIDLASKRFGGTLVVTSDQKLELTGCLNLTGQLASLQELGAIIALCDVWVTVDSAPLHMAQALSVQAVGIFGCTLPELRATRPSCLRVVRNETLDCLGCYHRLAPHTENMSNCERGDLACMEALAAGAVVEAVHEAMSGEDSQHLRDRMAAYERYRAERVQGHTSAEHTGAVVRAYQTRIAAFGSRFNFFKLVERKLRQHRKNMTAWFLGRR